jgi:Na+-driven multidrug efflux pump
MTTQRTPTALGTEKIGTLLMQYSVPAIIAMTASSLYNMVDSIFIGHGWDLWLYPDWLLRFL